MIFVYSFHVSLNVIFFVTVDAFCSMSSDKHTHTYTHNFQIIPHHIITNTNQKINLKTKSFHNFTI